MTEIPAPVRTKVPQFRRFTWWTFVLLGAFVLLVAVIQLALDDGRPAPVALLAVTAVAIQIQRTRFVNQAMRAGRPGTRLRAEHVATVAVSLGLWGFAMLAYPPAAQWTLVVGVIGSAVVLTRPAPRRTSAALLLCLLTGATGAAGALLGGTQWQDVWIPLAISALVPVPVIVADALQMWLWDVLLEVDQARAVAGELAVARERLRFAADLHDIQGHHLQAILLKGELAERLIGHDDETARQQAGELTQLARTALTKTRDVVHGYRNTDLRTEIANAVDILRAAGIDTAVHGDAASIPPPLQQLFGGLVREGTTNILRHSHAHRCELTLRATGGRADIRLRNDGVTSRDPGSGSGAGNGNGIGGLRERFALLGGTVRTTRDGEWFELSGHAAEPEGN